MRLLGFKTDGEFSLTEFVSDDIPPYAILSHTWEADDEEVTFTDLAEGAGKNKTGYGKIQFCGEQAASDDICYFWVDTCCIDKSNNTELSEAITSMFRWYRDAAKCYVYLSDVSIGSSSENNQFSQSTWELAFRESRWFTRGWTLQELIAPASVEFFSREGERLGDKKSLEKQIHEITEIPVQVLRGSSLSDFSVKERMTWAEKRKTKRKEDKAYSLLGIFSIYMPLIYGEGENAIIRLRRKISKSLKDGVYASPQDRQRHRIITDWLSTADFPAKQSDFIASREPGTGEWFLDSPEFTTWLCTSKGTLFCPGIPGAGKTMIAAITINHLMAIQSDSVGLAYIFCNYKAQVEQNITGLLAAILKQLVQGRSSITVLVSHLHKRHSSRGTRPSLKEIFTALQSVVRSFSITYIVVDALDECSNQDGTRSRLLARLHDLQQEADLRLIVTSRFIPDIENQFRLMPALEIRASEADVKRFVHSQIYRLPKCVQRDCELQAFVEGEIVEVVNGMLVLPVHSEVPFAYNFARFLLARLYVDSLLDKRTKAKIYLTLETLSNSSKSLDEAYDDALKRIEAQLPEDSVLARTSLSWITYAQRPLTTGELCHALAVNPGKVDLNKDNIPDIEDIVSVCAGLVTVDEESNIIRLVHYTTQEYFERKRKNWNPKARRNIAAICLTYLSFNSFGSGSSPSDKEFEIRLQENVFLAYAAQYWGLHVLEMQEEVSELALPLLQDANLISCAVQTMFASGPALCKFPGYSEHFPKQEGLHLTAMFGLLYLSEKLLYCSGREIIPADSKDSDGRTPLSRAAGNGHEAVVKLLLENERVDPNSRDSGGRTPLLWAVGKGHETVVKLLLENERVDPNSKDSSGRTPLSWAAENGYKAVVKLLLMKEIVDPDLKDSSIPFEPNGQVSREAVEKRILKEYRIGWVWKGSSIFFDSDGRTPLSWAAGSGLKNIFIHSFL